METTENNWILEGKAISLSEASKSLNGILSVSPSKLRAWAKEGKIAPMVAKGKRFYFHRDFYRAAVAKCIEEESSASVTRRVHIGSLR